ncbi:hypothetical protein WA1_30435 [Scytonema hofmannii PCC 7110]|uniref:Uncharacterized protein n=1 Tax=Scytonema hofmannii PCC 7110 TaxID=128403 RepID=A0A139X4P5_9CYAN|nr:hypothetical protein WA1_30435 [Scytonema hofmannii PCC 7110]
MGLVRVNKARKARLKLKSGKENIKTLTPEQVQQVTTRAFLLKKYFNIYVVDSVYNVKLPVGKSFSHFNR